MPPIDQVHLAFDPKSLFALNVILALILFGVALDLTLDDFRRVLRAPRAPLLGLVAQFVLLPALALLLVTILRPVPSVALGMILVASCPGGNLSNYFTHLARGATPVSVSMTAVSTTVAVVATPLNLALWGGLNPDTAALLANVEVQPLEMLGTVALLLAVPLVAGMTLAAQAPGVAAALRPIFRVGSLLFFGAFVLAAFHANFDHFLAHIHTVFLPVALLNGLAFALGWGIGRIGGLDEADRRAVAIEVGIQNSGLGLILVFDFFHGLGGMAVICAWWGLWHILAGLGLAGLWRQRPPAAAAAAA